MQDFVGIFERLAKTICPVLDLTKWNECGNAYELRGLQLPGAVRVPSQSQVVMNNEPKSIWRKSWRGAARVLPLLVFDSDIRGVFAARHHHRPAFALSPPERRALSALFRWLEPKR